MEDDASDELVITDEIDNNVQQRIKNEPPISRKLLVRSCTNRERSPESVPVPPKVKANDSLVAGEQGVHCDEDVGIEENDEEDAPGAPVFKIRGGVTPTEPESFKEASGPWSKFR